MAEWKVGEPTKLTLDGDVDRVRVRLLGGVVRVVATDGPARLEVREVRKGPLTVRHENGGVDIGYLEVSTPRKAFWWSARQWHRRARVSLAVPRDCRADIGVAKGEVTVTGLRHEVSVRVMSGPITLAGLGGDVEAETMSGSIEAHGVAGDLNALTMSGAITVGGLGGGRVVIQTMSGAVTADLDRAGNVQLNTMSGAITARVPGDSDLRVWLHTTSGHIRSAFDLYDDGLPAMNRMRGTIGSGAGALWAHTTSGSVTLLAKDPVKEDA